MSTGTGNAPNSPYQRVRNGSSYDMRDLSGAPSIGRPPTVTAPGSPSWRPTRDFTVNSTTPTSVNRGLPSSPQDFETAVLHILKKLEYEMWQNESAKLKDDLTTRDRAVGVVNSMTVVGAFIAGVQAQMISFTYSSNDTALQIATNWFAFAGLTLDVLGASGGVVHAVNLQLYIPRLQEAVNRTEAFHAAAAQVRDLLGQHSSASRAQIAASLREMNAITHQLRLWARGPLTSNPQGPNADSLWGRVFNGVTNVLAASEGTGIKQASLPMVAYGTVCLLLDIMCFAVSTQAKVVWGSAIAIAAVSFIAIVAPVVLLRFREMLALWQFRLDEAREDDMYKEIAFTETLADSNPSIVHELP